MLNAYRPDSIGEKLEEIFFLYIAWERLAVGCVSRVVSTYRSELSH